MKSSKIILSLGLAAIALAACGQKASEVRTRISIVGSSTVFPFSSAVAESFGAQNNGNVPKVEATGTGGGMKVFCAGSGAASVDIVNASRPMKKSEYDECQKNGVKEIVEFKIGYDGIVLANSKTGDEINLSRKNLYLALAKQVPVNGALVDNPYKLWSDVDPALPKTKIDVLGPPPTSGTRDAFAEMILEKGAEEVPFMKDLKSKDKDAFKKASTAIREDGAWKDMGENDNLIVQALASSKQALGVFGYSFYEENKDKLKSSKINNVVPDIKTILDGSYPASRSLFFYVKKGNLGYLPSIKNYTAEFMSAKASGEKGYLVARGLIPLKAEDLAKEAEKANAMPAMAAPQN